MEVLRGLLPEKDAKSMLPDVSDTFCSFFEKGDFDKLKWQKLYTQSFEKGLYTDWLTQLSPGDRARALSCAQKFPVVG